MTTRPVLRAIVAVLMLPALLLASLAWIPTQSTDSAPVRVEMMGKAERERTPPAFAEFLLHIARASEVRQRAAA
jgi:hypothetical protein